MPGEINIEKQIQEAMARGEFDNLPGKGKPQDLDAYFSTPEELRMAYSLLKSNDYVPEEVEMLKDIAALKEAAGTATDPDEAAAIRAKLHDKQLALTVALEKYKRRK